MKNDGYRILLFFLWLPSADLAVARVKNRVRQGGHNVPEPVIRRRFESGIRNLFQLYRPQLNAWWLYDASRLPPKVVAQEDGAGNLFNLEISMVSRELPLLCPHGIGQNFAYYLSSARNLSIFASCFSFSRYRLTSFLAFSCFRCWPSLSLTSW